MKVLVVGDVHGRTIWKKFVEHEEYDKVVFLGDYFDSYTINGDDIIENFKEIVQYKENNMEKVVLCFGNHDLHYLPGILRYSGYKSTHALLNEYYINDALRKELFNAAEEIFVGDKSYIFSHAGISAIVFLESLGFEWSEAVSNDEAKIITETMDDLGDKIGRKIVDFLNKQLYTNHRYFELTPYHNEGDHESNKPMWIRPTALIKNAPNMVNQIFGHTQSLKILITRFKNYDSLLGLCDTLEQKIALVIEYDDKTNNTEFYALTIDEENNIEKTKDKNYIFNVEL